MTAANPSAVRVRLAAGGTLIGLIAIALAILYRPLGVARLESKPDPAGSYEEAIRRIEAMQALDTSAVNPVCHTFALTHGEKTQQTVVILHGFTNCPEQFRALATQLHEQGYNVFVPRLPRHGMADRLTTELAWFTAEEAVQFTDDAVDIGAGLGEHITLVGLSAGGVMAAWAAQTRSDLDRALLLAPNFGIKGFTPALNRPITGLALTLPNLFRWWDAEAQAELAGPPQVYPRYSTRAVGEIMRIGIAVQQQARRGLPAAAAIQVVTSGADQAVSNESIERLVAAWRAQGADVATYAFPPEQNIHHDMIDPQQVNAQPDVVYPVLITMIEQRR